MSGEGRVALVTGTSRGIGVAIASRMLDDGFRVVGASRSTSPLEGRPGFVSDRCDLRDDDLAGLVPRILGQEGRIDVLVNNAGVMVHAPMWETRIEDLRRTIETNLTAPFVLSRDVARAWVGAGARGSIVNICSIESEVAWVDPPQASYAVSKGGLVGLTRALALDLASYGIRVNGVAPGAIGTDMGPKAPEASSTIPVGRLGRPQEVASAVAFVASEEASYMTGEILYIDGGYRLR